VSDPIFRDLSLHSEECQKRFHLFLAHFLWVAFARPTDEEPAPVNVVLFGASAVMEVTDALARLVKQLQRLQGR
jgi:hypothetical protein